MYIKPNDSEQTYSASVIPFKTQHGIDAVRVIGENLPSLKKGFKFYTLQGILIGDYSDYTHLYRENEYSVEDDVIVEPEGTNDPIPDSPYDILSRRISNINSKVNAITPYEQTKTAYYGEKEKTFYGMPNGNITVYFTNYEGNYSVSRANDKVTVSFDTLTEATDITISII